MTLKQPYMSGQQIRDALGEGFTAALNDCARSPSPTYSPIEALAWCRGYDALAEIQASPYAEYSPYEAPSPPYRKKGKAK